MDKPTTVRVATYTRISTDEDHQPYSLGSQAERLESYIKSQEGWQLARTFTDQMTGTTLERPGLQRALLEARNGRFDLLLVYRVDRLSRSVRGLAQVLDDLDRAKVVFRSATEPFDTGSPAGRMMVQMLGVFAEFERATIVDRVIAGMERKAARGGWNGGQLPFGYGRDPESHSLVVEESEAALVPVIFDLYVNKRLGARSIAEWLNERGHRTKPGKLWGPLAVFTVLTNRVYLGEIFFRDKHHQAAHQTLIDTATFEAAERIREERGENHHLRRSNSTDYLLGGLVVCDGCGKHFIGTAAHGNRYRYRYYTCFSRRRYGRRGCQSDSLPADQLDRAVLEALAETFAKDDLIAEAVAEAHVRANADQPRHLERLAAVDLEIKKADEAVERYLGAFEAGTMLESICGPRLEALAAKLAQLRSDRADLETSVEVEAIEPPTASQMDLLRSQIRAAIDNGTVTQRKALLQALVAEVRVKGRNSIQPIFRVPTRKVRQVDGLVRPAGIEPAALRSGDRESPLRTIRFAVSECR